MVSISNALRLGESRLAAGGIAEARRDAISLLTFVLQKDRSFFYAHPEHSLSPDEIQKYHSVIARRSLREPLQYITGVQEFYGLEFEVTPDVLIPRPETEMVVEQAIQLLGDGETFCEVGSGSGCIAVSVLVNRIDVAAVALDISPDAIEVTGRNAERHGVASRLRTVVSNLFSAFDGEHRFDVITSNPPYVPVKDLDGLQAEVRDFEPRIALTDEDDGLAIVRSLIERSTAHLRGGGYLLIEIGFGQSEKVAQMFDETLWHHVEFLPDFQGIPRVVKARLR